MKTLAILYITTVIVSLGLLFWMDGEINRRVQAGPVIEYSQPLGEIYGQNTISAQELQPASRVDTLQPVAR